MPEWKSQGAVTLSMLAASIVTEEMLAWLGVAEDAGMPLNLYSLRRITDDRIIEAETLVMRRQGLLLLAATAMLLIAAKDHACGTKEWLEDDDNG